MPASHRLSHPLPSLPVRRRLYLVKAFTAFFLLLPAALPARAGSYTLTSQTGGVYCNDFSNHVETPYDPSHGCSGATGYSYVPSNPPGTPSAYCQGTITTTYTWNPAYPDEPPPLSVIVIEACTARWSSSGNGASGGSCSDGLDDDEADTVNRAGSNSGFAGGVSSGTHYKVLSGGSTVTVTCSPSATTAPGSGFSGVVEADVSYCVNISPVTVGLGGTKKDSSGSDDILIGQGCTASLDGIPTNYTYETSDVAVSYHWSIGGTRFQSWTGTTTASSYVDGPGPLTNSTAHWYWNEAATTETVFCTATVTPPAGQGSPFTVTATKQVNVMEPQYTHKIKDGISQVGVYGNHTGLWFFAGPPSDMSHPNGSDWYIQVTTPPLFGSAGAWDFVQVFTPGFWRTPNNGTEQASSINGQFGLDTSYPYEGDYTDEQEDRSGDSPGTALEDAYQSYRVDNSFDTYVMYKPPGADVQYVPLHKFSWSWSGSVTRPGTTWSNWQIGTNPGTLTHTNDQRVYSFPSWQKVNTARW